MKFFIINTFKVNSVNSKFFINKIKNYMLEKRIPHWEYDFESAKLVVDIHSAFTNVFSMLTTVAFENDLCLFKSVDDIPDNFLYLTNDSLKTFRFFKLNISQKMYFNKYIDKNISYI